MLPVYNNRTPLNLTNEQKEAALKIIKDTVHNLAFFGERLKSDPNMNDVHTHMGLFEYSLRDLTELVHYDSVLKEEMERRHKEVRTLNLRVRELEEQLGKEVSAATVVGAIRRYEDMFCAWYEAIGFRYASIKYLPHGIRADFSSELNNAPSHSLTSNKELFNRIVAEGLYITTNENWDIVHDSYHSELLDTQKNKENVMQLFAKRFPQSTICEFRARKNDYDSFSMRFEVYVSYEDICRLDSHNFESEENQNE